MLTSGRDMLWSDPTADLPDVLLSESIVYATEGDAFTYTVVLTHAPGMREDQTIDLLNDEVRIYLTSSQEVYQQNAAGAAGFQQVDGHRTQLAIDTDVVQCTGGSSSGDEGKWTDAASVCEGGGATTDAAKKLHTKNPIPWYYVPYSTVNPSHASPVDTNKYTIVCPVCTHTKYCTQSASAVIDAATDDVAQGTGAAPVTTVTTVVAADVGTSVDAFDGCLDITYKGFAPVFDAFATVTTAYVTQGMGVGLFSGIGGVGAALDTTTRSNSHTAPDGLASIENTLAFIGTADRCLNSATDCLTVGTFDGVTNLVEASAMGPKFDMATNLKCTAVDDVATSGTACAVSARSGQATTLKQSAYVGSAATDVTAALVTMKSDFRMDADGGPTERYIDDFNPYCRYCSYRPGLMCSATLNDGATVFPNDGTRACNAIPVSGGDQAPATWRGDVSSSAQLVFDSTNWNTPQTVKVTAYDDSVYEAGVNGRGQDAFVHHFVVAQDENLQHTYYDNIDVNDLTVSVTDNDKAVVLEAAENLTPGEGYDYHSAESTGCATVTAELEHNDCLTDVAGEGVGTWTSGSDLVKLKLSSEPLYDVTVYVQSGAFFSGTPSATTLQPDDEQVIFQDMAQWETCFTTATGFYEATCAPATTVPGCDPHGSFLAGESYTDQTAGSPHQLPNSFFGALGSYPVGLNLGDTCADLPAVQASCELYQAAGCAWDSGTSLCTTANYLLGVATKAHDVTCATYDTSTCGTAAAPKIEGCVWDALLTTPACRAEDLGYDCNSYLVFTPDNWDVEQTLKVIAVDDDDDETPTLLAALKTAAEGRAAAAKADGVPFGTLGPFGADASVVGYLITSQDWYYNSAGSRFIEDTMDYQPKEADRTASNNLGSVNSRDLAGSDLGTVKIGMFDTRFGHHINRYPWAFGGVGSAVADSGTALLTAPVGIGAPNGATALTAGGAGWATIAHCGTSSPKWLCAVNKNHAADAANLVCKDAVGTWTAQVNAFDASRYTASATCNGVATTETEAECKESLGTCTDPSTATTDKACTGTFTSTAVYAAAATTDGAVCGATVHTQDNNNKGVLISRTACEATEGRRNYYQTAADNTATNVDGHVKDPTGVETRFGLFLPASAWTPLTGVQAPVYGVDATATNILCPPTPTSLAANGAGADCDGYGDTIDFWTAGNVLATLVAGLMTTNAAVTAPLYMTMPTCPFTVQLASAPAEGKTVSIRLGEDANLAALRDNELFFYEEPTFRILALVDSPGNGAVTGADGNTGVWPVGAKVALSAACAADATDAACVTDCDIAYPGSIWLEAHDSGSCYIQNVPLVGTGSPAGRTAVTAFIPRGGKTIDIPFTARDWSIGRRITIIALNDDIDEPHETRVAYHTVEATATTDDIYDDAEFANGNTVTVHVFDDDIADVVLLCADNIGGTGTGVTGTGIAADAAEDSATAIGFLGSYDDRLRKADSPADLAEITGLLADFDAMNVAYGENVDGDDGTTALTVARKSYSAEDGLAHGAEHSFGGGIAGATAGVATAKGVAGAGLTPTATTAIEADVTSLGYVTAAEALADGTDADVAVGCVSDADGAVIGTNSAAVLERCYPDTWKDWVEYDPYADNYHTAAIARDANGVPVTPTTANEDDYDEAFAGAADIDKWVHVRGFKGVGPAATEGANNFACTVHTRECEYDSVGVCVTSASDNALTADDKATCDADATTFWSYYKTSNGATTANFETGPASTPVYTACENANVGSFKVRLNSSPGQKSVRRQYIGEADVVIEKELVHVVVTPDVTPQTAFEPASVTFTETGGIVDGKATQRWDKPAVINVRPVDDSVDERRGFTVDYTALSVTTSHGADTYFDYTVPYQGSPSPSPSVSYLSGTSGGTARTDPGAQYVYGATAASGRTVDHTLFRHTIRTIHTMDNDYAGVTVKDDAGTTTATVTEGGSFDYYTLKLDTQPAKIQRQSGTGPNLPATHATGCGDGETGADDTGGWGVAFGVDASGAYNYFADNTYVPRLESCGSVEPAASYWVDVTVTQSIHVDLAVPPSCPTTAPWGGGSTPPTAEHARFPFNAWGANSMPYDEVNGRYEPMAKYLTTCGTWQRDATYRFDATNWDTPQYVYVYAHNDKDGLPAPTTPTSASQVGSDAASTTTVLKHYVETQDAADSVALAQNVAIASNALTAASVFVQRNKHGGIYTLGNIERFPFGASKTTDPAHGAAAADPTDSGAVGGSGAVATLHETGFTTYGYSSYENLYGHVKPAAAAAAGVIGADYPDMAVPCTCHSAMPRKTMGSTAAWKTTGGPAAACIYDDGQSAGTACTETVSGLTLPVPYDSDGNTCIPTPDGATDATVLCLPRFAKIGVGTAAAPAAVNTGSSSALFTAPADVTVTVTDNDDIAAEVANTAACRQTQLFQFADSTGVGGSNYDYGTSATVSARATAGDGVLTTKWLIDYNCKNGDAGGLPGYPAGVAVDGALPEDNTGGYCTDKLQASKTLCVAENICTVAGECTEHPLCASEDCCGTCDDVAFFTDAECVKATTTPAAGGTWTAGTWTPSTSGNCISFGGEWVAHKWAPFPAGSGLVNQGTAATDNLQCCSCTPAYGSGVAATTLSGYATEKIGRASCRERV